MMHTKSAKICSKTANHIIENSHTSDLHNMIDKMSKKLSLMLTPFFKM